MGNSRRESIVIPKLACGLTAGPQQTVLQEALECCDLCLISGVELSLSDVSDGTLSAEFLMAMDHLQSIGSSSEELDNGEETPDRLSMLIRIEAQLVQLAANAYSLEAERSQRSQIALLDRLVQTGMWVEKRVRQAESRLHGGVRR